MTNPQDLKNQFIGSAEALLGIMENKDVTDVLINGLKSLYIEQNGKLISHPNPFLNQIALTDFIERLLIPLGKRVDASQPYLDGRLVDGSRFHVILPPLAVHGPLISIRKHQLTFQIALEDFCPPPLVQWLKEKVLQRKTFLIVGGTGVGKTTILSCLLREIPSYERIVILEESIEIHAEHPHVIRLEARPPSPEGKGEVSLRSLLRNALRMRPDRILLGEVRGAEAFDMLQTLNTGHTGSLSTIHANSALDGLRRLETLALLSGLAIPLKVIREWIGANVDFVIYVERKEGVRSVSEILEVHGLEGDVYRVSPTYRKGGGSPQNSYARFVI